MNRNNIYTVNPLYNGSTTQTTEDGSVQSGGTTIIYQQGGGTGLTDAQKQKLDGIQEGAEVNQNAYSKVRLNGSDALIIEAKNKTDILNMSGVYPIAIAINGNGGLDFTVSSDQSNTNSVVTQSQLKAAIDQLEKDKYWKVDADGKLYTELDVYSHKEISAYGAGDGGGSTGGAGALYECADVLRDGDKVQGAAVGSILSYNGSHWYAIPQSAITPDLTNYATKSYVTQQINDLIGGAPGTLDTLKEIAEALGNNPNFATTVTEMINNIGLRVDQVEDRVVSLEDMFEWDKSASASDPSLWRIKAKKDLYGVGEISAYGYSSGTVPTGAQYMYELKDVLFTELTSGQLLQWNGTKWINIDKNAVGLNETELAKYLTNNNYAKKSDITWANLLNKPTTWGWASITGKPTTLAGYGITDGVPNTRRVSAGSGLAGGGVLSSDVTISLGTIGTAGTYTKITTDMYGRVVSGTTLSESDIPTLQISKISGLQSALDSKLNISDFNTWFTINRDTSGNIVSIQANYNLFSVGEVSAYGLGGTQPSITTLAGLDDVNISNPQNKQALIYDSASGKWINGASVAGGNISLNGTVYEAVDGLITLPNLVDIAGDQVITGTKTFKAAGNLKFGTSTNGITLAVDSGKLAVANYANSTHAGIQASFFKKVSGTSSQFLKADGSVDGNLYALAYNGNQNKVLESNVSNSLHVIDRRESSPAPTDFEARTISTFFNLNNMPSSTWWSGISVSGWSNEDYVTWQLAGPSSTNNSTANLRFRTGIGSSWNEWKMILDKDYADGLYVRKTGDISGSAAYFPTAYIGGTQANPQTYFNQNMGLRVAMTGIGFGGPWSDTLWINGYSGNDVLPMCALHFIRNGTPRFGISTQNSNGTSYGTNYEVWTAYNSNKDGVNWSAQTFFSSIGLKSRNICIETDNSGNNGGCSSEINNWNSRLYLQHKSGQHLQMCNGGGNVAIGGISPDYKLNVSGDIRASSWIRTDGATGWYSQSYGGGIYMTDSDMVQVYNNKVLYNSGYRSWGIGGHYCGIKLYNTNHIGINLANSSYTWGIYSNQDGNMYIGRRNGDVNNTTGSYVVTITGSTLSVTGSVVASGEVTAYSDARLKSNIHTLNYRGRLIPRHYVKDSKQSIGFIAQEVQTLYPELVLGYDKSRPYLSLNYNGCTAVLSAQLNYVEDEVTMLKNKVRELEIKVSILTEQLHSQAI